MTDWTSGYRADIDYTYGYYGELNPQRIKLAFLSAGLACPEVIHACELGFGQGISVNAHAVGSSVTWHGTDFNPSQAAFAREMASACESNASLSDEAFDAFAAREDLPNFDFIGLHGIWSWISDANREHIVDFVRRKLNVGGVVYVSYNTLPGWSGFAPMRHLLSEHVSTISSAGAGVVAQVDEAVEFSEKLLKLNPAYSKVNPQVAERFDKLKKQDRHYLAHEYFNQDWQPMHFGTIAKALTTAKLDFACSARFKDHVDAINLNKDQQTFLADISSNTFRETVRDFMVNTQFRADYWVKGARTLNAFDRDEALRAIRVLLVVPMADVPMKVAGNQGEVTLLKKVYQPFLELLGDYKINTLGEMEKKLAGKKISFTQIAQAALILIGGGQVVLAQDESNIQKAQAKTEKLNAYIMNKARGSNEIQYLASPVTGGGVPVSRFDQLFLLAKRQDKTKGSNNAKTWGSYVWQVLAGRGQKVIKQGEMIDKPEDNEAHLQKLAKTFEEKVLPIFEALEIR